MKGPAFTNRVEETPGKTGGEREDTSKNVVPFGDSH